MDRFGAEGTGQVGVGVDHGAPGRGRAAMALLLSLAIAALPALIGAGSTPGPWYDALNKPSFTPPGSVFGPVWALMYLSLAVSAWLIWRVRGSDLRRRRALWVYLMHLALNAAWSPLFFSAQMPGAAFALICLIWLTAIWVILEFGALRSIAGLILVPYALWLSFALVLNGVIWIMNA